MIFQDSRYATACIESVPDDQGVYHATLYSSCTPPPAVGFSVYQVHFGDRLDSIAALTLGDSELWWQVADANPELIYPDQLTVGMFIRIPARRSG